MPLGFGVAASWLWQRYQWMIDEANEGGNALPVVVYLLKMHDAGASPNSAAFGELQQYGLDGSPPLPLAEVGHSGLAKAGQRMARRYKSGPPWPSVSGRV